MVIDMLTGEVSVGELHLSAEMIEESAKAFARMLLDNNINIKENTYEKENCSLCEI